MTDPLPSPTTRPPHPLATGATKADPFWSAAVVPVMVFVVISGVGVWLWSIETSRQAEAVAREVRVAQTQLARRLEQVCDDLFRPLRRLRRDFMVGREWTAETFATEAAGLEADQPALVALAWTGADGVVRDVVPLAGNEAFAGLGASKMAPWAKLLDDAMVARDGAAGAVFRAIPSGSAGRPGTLPFVLPFVGVSHNGPDLRGALLGLIDLSLATRDLTDSSTRDNFQIDLRDPAGVPVALAPGRDDGASVPVAPDDSQPEPVRILNSLWSIRLRPTPAFIAIERGPPPLRLLVAGVAVALLLAGSMGFVRRQRRRVLAQAAVHQRALESLNELSAGIGGRLGEGHAVMDQLARVAVELTGMDMASVAVLGNGGKTLDVIASFGQDPPLGRTSFPLGDIPTARQCIETGRVVVVPDTDAAVRAGTTLNRPVLDRYGIHAIMQIPLKIDDGPIGALALGSRTPRAFSDADVRLAELFGSHAAVILLNNRLLQQTRRAVRVQKRLTHQRRLVFRLMASVYRARSVEESVRRVARLSPGALSVDAAAVCVPTERADYFRVAGAGPKTGTEPLVVGAVLYLPDAGRALVGRKMVVVGPADPWASVGASVGANVLGAGASGSVAYLPLVAHDPKPIGVLVLVRRRGRGLRRSQLRTASLLASRAAVAIEASDLHHRARVDASANATLLRELNHRVKNNLAGIAGLLSIGQPVLNTEARQWLDRAIERINTMARAHELFTGGAGAIALPNLIDRLMPTLCVLAPAGVTVRAEVDRAANAPVARARLDPDRAVALAMVLHELCVNAIVHGLGDRGTLTIRAAVVDEPVGGADESGLTQSRSNITAVVDVIDEGGTGGAGLVRHRSTGMGLDLVRGLVERELGGTFTLDLERPGRTVASVRLPVARTEPFAGAV